MFKPACIFESAVRCVAASPGRRNVRPKVNRFLDSIWPPHNTLVHVLQFACTFVVTFYRTGEWLFIVIERRVDHVLFGMLKKLLLGIYFVYSRLLPKATTVFCFSALYSRPAISVLSWEHSRLLLLCGFLQRWDREQYSLDRLYSQASTSTTSRICLPANRFQIVLRSSRS